MNDLQIGKTINAKQLNGQTNNSIRAIIINSGEITLVGYRITTMHCIFDSKGLYLGHKHRLPFTTKDSSLELFSTLLRARPMKFVGGVRKSRPFEVSYSWSIFPTMISEVTAKLISAEIEPQHKAFFVFENTYLHFRTEQAELKTLPRLKNRPVFGCISVYPVLWWYIVCIKLVDGKYPIDLHHC
ncbi:hypothetical protein J6590_060536 [Homalodisca vitripennis]|nr:hypothetical protein J6590_060536 [Homalodisca vitripennis]